MERRHSKKVEAYIKSFEKPKRVMLEALREVVLKTLPGVEEEFKYNVPFYKPVCYLSIRKGVACLSFCYGSFLPKKYGLVKERGKFVRHLIFHSYKDTRKKKVFEVLRTAYRKRSIGLLLNKKSHTRLN
jgi:hypothetical protein